MKSRPAMVNVVLATMQNLESQGKPEYMQRAKEEAEYMGVDIRTFLQMAIEHQICVRTVNSRDICLPSGLGDKLHSFVAKIDSVTEKAPSPIKSVVQRVAKTVTKTLSGEEHRHFSRCSSCGGSRSFSKKTWNLGRAGRLQ